MPTFIVQANYSMDAVKGMMGGAKNRREVIAGIIEAAGGRMVDMYMTTGEYDILCITEFDSLTDGLAVNMVVGASGAATGFNTIQAWSPEEFQDIAAKAAGIAASYTPPGG